MAKLSFGVVLIDYKVKDEFKESESHVNTFQPVHGVLLSNVTLSAQENSSQTSNSIPITEQSTNVESTTKSQTSSPELGYSTIPSTWKSSDPRFQGVTVRKFFGKREVPFSLFDPFVFKKTNQTDVTVIAVTTSFRLFYIPFLLKNWQGRYCLVVYGSKEEEDSIVHTYLSYNNTERITLMVYTYESSNMYAHDFPVNLLRNVGIRQVETSHFLLLDMDMWLSQNMYGEVKRIPAKIMNDEKSLIIIPAIFLHKYRILKKCTDFKDCVLSSLKEFPHSKNDVNKCVKDGSCFLGKSKITTHKYTSMDWLKLPTTMAVMKYRCFTNYEQEPYYIVKYTPLTIVYHEDYINYGFNKIQYFEHWRMRGARFYIIVNSFAVDVPHPDSSFRKSYVSKYVNTKVSPMEIMFKKHKNAWAKEFKNVKSIPICRKKKSLYENP